MQDHKYMSMTINVFKGLQRKHNLKLVKKNTTLHYSNQLCWFSVCIERNFEFCIYFYVAHTELRLHEIVRWLEFENSDIDRVIRNQISNESDAEFVLNNLREIMEKLLPMIENNPQLMVKLTAIQQREKKDMLSNHTFLLIRRAWSSKDYDQFLDLVESNRLLIEQSKGATLIFKQEAYIKKLKTMHKK